MRRIAGRLRRRTVTLWTMVVPPTVWAAHFLFSYLWAALMCAKVGAFAAFPTLYVAATAVAIVVIVASGVIAWVQAREPGDAPPHDAGTTKDRQRFLATATVLLAALSTIAVVFTAAPVAFLTDCR